MKHTSNKTDPITSKEEVKQSKDQRIDQDFKGFPNAPAKENIINPKTTEDRKTAAVNGENNPPQSKKDAKVEEADSDGSAGAFNAADPLPDTSYYQKKKEATNKEDEAY